jgi:hypothetical protein
VTKATGARIPLDVEPSERGNVLVHIDGLAEVLSEADMAEWTNRQRWMGRSTTLRVSHFATCPNAAKHRRAR